MSNFALSKRANDMPPPPSPPPKEEEEYERALSYEERGNLSSSSFSCTELLCSFFPSISSPPNLTFTRLLTEGMKTTNHAIGFF